MKLGLPLGSHRTQHTKLAICIFRELQKTGSHPGLNWGPLTLVVSALPPELWPPGVYMYTVHVHVVLYTRTCTVHVPDMPTSLLRGSMGFERLCRRSK